MAETASKFTSASLDVWVLVTSPAESSATHWVSSPFIAAGVAQTLAWYVENRLAQAVSGTITTTMGYDGDGKRVTLPDPNGVTLFVSPLCEVFVPVTATMPTITSTVYPTQTYTARLPVVGGSWHGVDGALGEVTKYYFADGKCIAMREGSAGDVTYLYQDHLGSASLAVGHGH